MKIENPSFDGLGSAIRSIEAIADDLVFIASGNPGTMNVQTVLAAAQLHPIAEELENGDISIRVPGRQVIRAVAALINSDTAHAEVQKKWLQMAAKEYLSAWDRER
jgi:hypothetical protein